MELNFLCDLFSYECFCNIRNIFFQRFRLSLDPLFWHWVSKICNNVTHCFLGPFSWGGYKSAQIAALLLYCAQGAAIEERRNREEIAFSTAALLFYCAQGAAIGRLLRRRNRRHRNRLLFIWIRVLRRLLLRRCNRQSLQQPQLAESVAAPVRISPQYERFYTTRFSCGDTSIIVSYTTTHLSNHHIQNSVS